MVKNKNESIEKSKYEKYLHSLSKDQLIKIIFPPVNFIKNKYIKSYKKIALKFSYYGKNFHGLVMQDNKDTVELRILRVMYYNGLINSFISNDISFAGRTDAGVSAKNMVMSVTFPSILTEDENSNILKNTVERNNSNENFILEKNKEYDYIKMLNSGLPEEILIHSYSLVPKDFDARHSCISRKYKYFFRSNNLNINLMKEICKSFFEVKNFENFCKKSKEKEFKKKGLEIDKAYYCRSLTSISIEMVEDSVYCLNIKAKSFLHNMVRKIFWVLQQVGLNNSIDIFYKILNGDVQCGTAKAENLLFYGCEYDENLYFLGSNENKNDYIFEKFIKSEIYK
ncbi:tRNA pseudouridine synthase [Hamiltosporidium tvaerminnensis]|uniref:tRNA pseudouridine synthase n=1 Tax=Hamiltosporidium tvaerminnensis TaxID=1176355 RepID=A0A4Q9M225_9MICR|nr:tRNA pseudouridine synthase [Hamiltosporidium tvaerminnensis]